MDNASVHGNNVSVVRVYKEEHLPPKSREYRTYSAEYKPREHPGQGGLCIMQIINSHKTETDPDRTQRDAPAGHGADTRPGGAFCIRFELKGDSLRKNH